MAKYLSSVLACAILACILSVCTFGQNTPTLPEDLGTNHGGGFGGGPRMNGNEEEVTYIVAFDENDIVVDCVEDNEENQEYIEILADDPKLYLTEISVKE